MPYGKPPAADVADDKTGVDTSAPSNETSAALAPSTGGSGAAADVSGPSSASTDATAAASATSTAQAAADVSGDVIVAEEPAPAHVPLTPIEQPRATLENLEAKFGPSEAELANAALSQSPTEAPVTQTAQPIDGTIETAADTEVLPDIAHPTIPHVFSALGDMYNSGVSMAESLETHIANAVSDGNIEMHSLLQRIQTLAIDFKNAVENVETAMSPSLRSAIEKMKSL